MALSNPPKAPTPSSDGQPITVHAVIAGTGRAGTTFLMEWLRTAGVPGPDLDRLFYSEDARAGFETALFAAGDHYLVKDPWLAEYLEEVDAAGIAIDALIVPVRDLRVAAASRVRRQLEHRARHGWYAGRPTEANVPGGIVVSLSVDDQERMLAVGLARLIAWALEREVPLHLLHYPRLIEDAEYAIDTLWPWLQRFCDRDTARRAFEQTRRPSPPDPVSSAGDAELLRLREEVRALERERLRLRSELRVRSARGRAVRVARAVGAENWWNRRSRLRRN